MVAAAGGSGLLVGAPYAGLGLANFGKVLLHCIQLGLLILIQFAQLNRLSRDKAWVDANLLNHFPRSTSSTQARSCQQVTSALSVREHLHLAQGGEFNTFKIVASTH